MTPWKSHHQGVAGEVDQGGAAEVGEGELLSPPPFPSEPCLSEGSPSRGCAKGQPRGSGSGRPKGRGTITTTTLSPSCNPFLLFNTPPTTTASTTTTTPIALVGKRPCGAPRKNSLPPAAQPVKEVESGLQPDAHNNNLEALTPLTLYTCPQPSTPAYCTSGLHRCSGCWARGTKEGNKGGVWEVKLNQFQKTD